MPKGIPVATVAIGNAANAALLAVRMLASADADLWARWDKSFPKISGKNLITIYFVTF